MIIILLKPTDSCTVTVLSVYTNNVHCKPFKNTQFVHDIGWYNLLQIIEDIVVGVRKRSKNTDAKLLIVNLGQVDLNVPDEAYLQVLLAY